MIDINKSPITADELATLYNIYQRTHFIFGLEDCFNSISKAVEILTEITKNE